VPLGSSVPKKLVREMDEAVYQQISNVAALPGHYTLPLCMPTATAVWVSYWRRRGDGRARRRRYLTWRIGFDINCGMRLITTNLTLDDVKPRLKEIVDLLFDTRYRQASAVMAF